MYDVSWFHEDVRMEPQEDCMKMFTGHEFCLTAGQTGSWLLGDWEYCGECTGDEGEVEVVVEEESNSSKIF